MVRMTHPNLPGQIKEDVLEQGVQGLERTGWQVMEDEPAQPEVSTRELAPEPADKPAASARRTSTPTASTGTGKE